MATDYVLFNHGVYTRDRRPQPTYADSLFERIESYCPGRTLSKVSLYWGDVNQKEEDELLGTFQSSSIWEKLWFLSFRENQLMQFIGDAALYTSRFCGAKVVNELADQAVKGLKGYNPKEDCLHIVTHSLGTVILFDVLFSARWDNYALCSNSITRIRSSLFGVSPLPEQGIRLGSVSTMGSPLGFFSLMNVTKDTTDTTTARDANGNIIGTHDIAPNLRALLTGLYQEQEGKKLPWYNFVHPGDPIAYPLEKLLPQLVDEHSEYIDVRDIPIQTINLTELLTEPFSQTLFALLHSGAAHDSYWNSAQVAKQIATAIEAS